MGFLADALLSTGGSIVSGLFEKGRLDRKARLAVLEVLAANAIKQKESALLALNKLQEEGKGIDADEIRYLIVLLTQWTETDRMVMGMADEDGKN